MLWPWSTACRSCLLASFSPMHRSLLCSTICWPAPIRMIFLNGPTNWCIANHSRSHNRTKHCDENVRNSVTICRLPYVDEHSIGGFLAGYVVETSVLYTIMIIALDGLFVGICVYVLAYLHDLADWMRHTDVEFSRWLREMRSLLFSMATIMVDVLSVGRKTQKRCDDIWYEPSRSICMWSDCWIRPASFSRRFC